ncbi:DUF3638 domain-containing protein [Gammaproteobacteria bacterium]|nr:DUF3638 domain-containing protein [Gammaproteobacteria bacterium]
MGVAQPDALYFVFQWNPKTQKLEHTNPNAIWLLISTLCIFDRVGDGIDEAFYYLRKLGTSTEVDALTHQLFEFIRNDVTSKVPEMLALRAHILKLHPPETPRTPLNLQYQWANIEQFYKAGLTLTVPNMEGLLRTPRIASKPFSCHDTYTGQIKERDERMTYPYFCEGLSSNSILRALSVTKTQIPSQRLLIDTFKPTESRQLYGLYGRLKLEWNQTTKWSCHLTTDQHLVPSIPSKTPPARLTCVPTRSIPPQDLEESQVLKTLADFKPQKPATSGDLITSIENGITDAEKETTQFKTELQTFIAQEKDFNAQIDAFLGKAAANIRTIEAQIHSIFIEMHGGSISYTARQHQTDEHFDQFLKTFAKIPTEAQEDLYCDESTYDHLMNHAKAWLWTKTHIQHHERLLQQVGEPELFFKSYTAKRNYTYDHPHAYLILLMEYQENVRLRPAQVQMINELCIPEDNAFPHRIVEAIMGDGKTFVAPIVAVARARALPQKLSILQLPMSIFKQQQCGISQQMQAVLGFEPQVFTYSREQTLDARSILEKLQKARDFGIPVITTAESIACLHLSALEKTRPDDNLNSIIHMIRQESHICTDEFDSVFDKTPVIYSLGDQGSLSDLDQSTTTTLHALLRIFMITVLTHNPSLAKMNQDDYQTTILPDLINRMINRECPAEDFPPHSALISKYKSHYQSFPTVIKKLSDKNTQPSEIDNLFTDPSQNSDAIIDLNLIHNMIHHVFPQALAMPSGLVYGRSQAESGSHIIVPFRNGKECVGARYNNPYTTLALTLLQSFRDGFTEQQLSALVTLLLPEYKQLFCSPKNSTLVLRGTLGKIIDQSLFPQFYEGLHLLDEGSSLFLGKISNLYQALSRNKLSLSFYKTLEAIAFKTILPGITFNLKKIRHTWAEAPKGSGFSGTTHNMALFPKHTATNSKIIDGRTLAKLKACEPKFYPESYLNNPDWLDDYLQSKPKTRAIIDAGSLMPVPDMHIFVKSKIDLITRHTGCTAILYFQESGFYALKQGLASPIKLSSFNRADIDHSLQVPVDQRFVFFSPAFCRGSDIVLQQDANALVMIRKDCQLSDTLQAIMRMRQFGSQRVDLLLEKDLYTHGIDVDTWWKNTCLLDQSRLQDQMIAFTSDYIVSYFQDLLWSNPKYFAMDQAKPAFITKSPDLIQRIQQCYQSVTPEDTFQALIESLAINYAWIDDEAKIQQCQEQSLEILTQMLPGFPRTIPLINGDASHEDTRQEAVQTQEQVKVQQQEQQREAECYCASQSFAKTVERKLDPEWCGLTGFPSSLLFSFNYRKVTTVRDRSTLYPVPYVLRTDHSWIALSEADKKFYDSGDDFDLGEIKRDSVKIIDMLALQKSISTLIDITGKINGYSHEKTRTDQGFCDLIKALTPDIKANIALWSEFKDADRDNFIYTLMLSGHYTQLMKCLSVSELVKYKKIFKGLTLPQETQTLLVNLNAIPYLISTKLSALQFSSDNKSLFCTLKALTPQFKLQIDALDRTNLSGLSQLKSLLNANRQSLETTHHSARVIQKGYRATQKISASNLMPNSTRINNQALLTAIKNTQIQKSWQFISSLAVLSLIFTAITLGSMFWLKLSLVAATLNMTQHLFSNDLLQQQSNASPKLAPYIFNNIYGFSKLQKATPSKKWLNLCHFIEKFFLFIMPYVLVIALFTSQVPYLLMIPPLVQLIFGGLKSMLTLRNFQKFSAQPQPINDSSLSKLYQLLKSESKPERQQFQDAIMSTHVQKGKIVSLPNLRHEPSKPNRLKIALAILSHCYQHKILLSQVPHDYFHELLLTAQVLGDTTYQGIKELLPQHQFQPIEPSTVTHSVRKLFNTYSPYKSKWLEKSSKSLRKISFFCSSQFRLSKIPYRPFKWADLIQKNPQSIQNWFEQIQLLLTQSKAPLTDTVKRNMLKMLLKNKQSYKLDIHGSEKMVPSFACALIIESHCGTSFKPTESETPALPLEIFINHTARKHQFVFSSEQSEDTVYCYQFSTHSKIQNLIDRATTETAESETLSDEALAWFIQLLKNDQRNSAPHQAFDYDSIPDMQGGSQANRDQLLELKVLIDKMSQLATLTHNGYPIQPVHVSEQSEQSHLLII